MPGPGQSPAQYISGPLSTNSTDTKQDSKNVAKEVKEEKDKVIKESKEQVKLSEEKALNIQCFLVDFMEDIAARRRSDESSVSDKYKSFAMLSGEPGDFCQLILSQKGLGELFNLSSAQKALIVPKIRIYKVMYDKGGAKTGKDIPLFFNDHLSEREVGNIVKGKKGRGDDVGVKSFSYTLANKMLGEGNYIECSLQLFFQNASSFLETRNNKISFQQLIWDKSLVSESGEAYASKSFHTKIVVGWATPSDPKNTLISPSLMKALERTSTVLFLTHATHDLEFNEDGSLSVTINFVGAMEGMLYDTQNANIFVKGLAGETADKLKKKLDDDEKKFKDANPKAKIDNSPQKKTETTCEEKYVLKPKNISTFGAIAKIALGGGALSNVEASDKKEKVCITKNSEMPNQKELNNIEYEKLQMMDRQEKYSRIIRGLYENSQMFYVDIDKSMIDALSKEESEDIDRRVGSLSEDAKDSDKSKRSSEIKKEIVLARAQKRENLRSSVNIRSKIFKVVTSGEQNYLKDYQKRVIDAIKSKYDPNDVTANKEYRMTIKSKSEEEITKIRASAGVSYPMTPSDCPTCLRAYFFYLGDLLDFIFNDYVIKREDIDNVRVLLGDLIFTDPRTNVSRNINLADIPISLERFMAWYSKKVIATQREIYVAGKFIEDLLREVFLDALGADCFGNTVKNLPSVNFNNFSISGMTKKEPLFWMVAGERYNIFELMQGMAKSNEDVLKKNMNVDPKNLYHYLYIYASMYSIKGREGNYKDDISKGIYHLAPGLDRGLVKSMKFTKDALASGAEMTLEGENREGGVSPNVYNVIIKMVGNNFFRNGIYIFIDTAKMGMGFGMKDRLSQTFHLGGYYLIMKVVHDFSNSGDYETTLEARWQSGKGGKSSGFSSDERCATKVIDAFTDTTTQSMGYGMSKAPYVKPEQSISKNIGKK